ncbi:Poly [ADP-ribose] polymerase 1 [Gossypium arboreum]|uniref:Poly [ADP-ribose] polymerase 1 n=1 Tax=Gossypium arboreum TaxID=29729 RepID=A0A0B0MVX1_GOSAR|nr:Poly [ADP-ribose] polymerase 1 [Gossypium arboreum]
MDMAVWLTHVRKSRPCWIPMWVHFLCFWPISRSFYSLVLT